MLIAADWAVQFVLDVLGEGFEGDDCCDTIFAQDFAEEAAAAAAFDTGGGTGGGTWPTPPLTKLLPWFDEFCVVVVVETDPVTVFTLEATEDAALVVVATINKNY